MYSLILLQIDNKGVTLNTGPGSYKIPMINDIPKQFNVTLLEDSVNDKAVYGSKVSTFLCNFVYLYHHDAQWFQSSDNKWYIPKQNYCRISYVGQFNFV